MEREEAGANREIIVFRCISFLENYMRSLITEKLKSYYGEKRWWELGVPPEVKLAIEDRRRKEKNAEGKAEEPILNYSLLLHLLDIILWKDERENIDNWENVFKTYFKGMNKRRIITDFKILNRIRTRSHHHRKISDDDVKWVERCGDELCVDEKAIKEFERLKERVDRASVLRKNVQRVEEDGKKLLENLLAEGSITQTSFNNLLALNKHLSQNLLSILQTEDINNTSYLLRLYKKPLDFNEAFEMMKTLIYEGSQDPKSLEVRKTAIEIGRKRMLIKYNSDRLPKIDQMYSYRKVPKEEFKDFLILLGLCTDVANALYAWLLENITYASDPPSLDYYQPAITTLKVKGGDCDDYTILACSMYRSIGFKTYIGFKKGHTYPGIVLVVPEEAEINGFRNIFNVFLPLDRDIPFNPFDILPEAYEGGGGVENYYKRLGEYSEHKIFEIDPDLEEL